MEEAIRKAALRNALDHGGKADLKAVVARILGDNPDFRARAKEIMPLVESEIKKINSTPEESLRKEAEIRYPELVVKEKKVQEHRLPDLKNVTGKVVMRLAPSPSGPLHVGHSRMAILNDEYTKRYGGSLILRLEDTNPANIDPMAYDQIPKDLEWLDVKVSKIVIQSSRMQIYYSEARKLIEKGHMYVCQCAREKFRKSRQEGVACEHRDSDPNSNLEKFEGMIGGEYASGNAVAVLKTDLKHSNPSIRDWIAFRISSSVHPLTGEKAYLYPTMNFSVAVDDHLLGLTHVIRGTDHINNTEKQSFIFKYNRWKVPEYFHYGLISIPGLIIKTSIVKKGILSGEFKGWDDVRLQTLMALARRGYRPETVRRYWIEGGMRTQNATFSWEIFNSMNRELIDHDSRRLFFVPSAQKLKVEGAGKMVAKIPFHPERKELGVREYELAPNPHVYVSRSDLDRISEGETFRLKDLCNVEKNRMSLKFSKDQSYGERKIWIVQWCPDNSDKFEVLKPDGTVDEGVIEPKHTEVQGISQLERYGYVKLQEKYGLFLHP